MCLIDLAYGLFFRLFTMIFCYIFIDDHSRIILTEKWTETDNDYINANFIKVNGKHD